MSADVWIEAKSCETCGRSGGRDVELNITYNLSTMLRQAGFCGWRELVGMTARDAGAHMLEVLDGMRSDEDGWRAMNHENGWGDYDRCLQDRMRDFAGKCLLAGDSDRIGGSL